jgi:hypothetical protein
MSVFTPAGSGGVVGTTTVVGATNPAISNVAMASASTEYSFVVPTNAKQFMLKLRGTASLQVAYTVGQSNTLYITVPRSCFYGESDLSLSAPVTLYFQSDQPAQVAEILVWT